MKRINEGVAGAHAIMPFQCASCWMQNLERREIRAGDETFVHCINRVNLDAINGKAKATILSHKRQVNSIVNNAAWINKTPSLEPRGPMPLDDEVGMGVAVDMLTKSIFARGQIRDTIQFDTMRTVRSTATKVYESSPRGVAEGSSFTKGTSRVRPTSCPSQSEFFSDFLRGAEYRMGYETAANHGVNMKALVAVLDFIKADIEACDNSLERNQLIKVGAFICLVTACSLRGYEGFYLDLAGVRRHIDKGRTGVIPANLSSKSIITDEEAALLPHVAVCLLGKFKGELGVDHHIINVANETMSGLEPRMWMEQLIEVCAQEGRYVGPAFAEPNGKLAYSGDYDSIFKKYLKKVQAETTLIPDDVNVDLHYSLNRTPRKSSTTRAQRANLDGKYIDTMNRWRVIENAKGGKPRFNMRPHYSEACLLMPTTWFYSYTL